MSLLEEIETYLIGRQGKYRRKRVERHITPALKAYRERGRRKDEE